MRIVAIILLCGCAGTAPEREYVQSLRDEYRALGKVQALLAWYGGTHGNGSPARVALIGHDRLFRKTALDAVARAQAAATGDDALALGFLRRGLEGEAVAVAQAQYDDAIDAAEAGATVRLPWREGPVAFRDADLVLSSETDPARRAEGFAAMNTVRAEMLNPILERREAAAQRAAREAGFADYVALAEDQRQVRLDALLEDGIAYAQATETIFRATLDRVAREELGIGRAELRRSDWARLWRSPRLAGYFDESLELKALRSFLSGMGLDLRTAGGAEVTVDDSPRPLKRARAFVTAVAAPDDVRLSVKSLGGLDGYWTLFHEAGHAVHFANATIAAPELRTQGYGAPTEAFGEFFRQAFSDPRWLFRYRAFLQANGRPAPDDKEVAAILRRTALAEMHFVRMHAFARIAWELRLHGRPAEEIAGALRLLPDPGKARGDPRELYRQLFSVASGFTLTSDDAEAFRTDVDDAFAAADYARAFVLAGQMHEAIRKRFGEDFYGDPRVGAFLKEKLFAPGMSLSADDVAHRLGFAGLDFAGAAARAARLIGTADALEQPK